MSDGVEREAKRRAALLAAQAKAVTLFESIEAAQLIKPGRTEREVEEDIFELARIELGVEKHRRIVRAGSNTLTIASDHPEARMIAPEDTVYVDLGPVFEEWEADVGRTYALGGEEDKKRLVKDLETVFRRVQNHYHASPEITGAELYAYAQHSAEDAGWTFGGAIAGHIVSEFAHMTIPGDKDLNRIGPRNPMPMREPDTLGRARHWILEIHLIDRARTFGGFYERLI